ncbi:MAG: Tol biopolymer transporter periplasmic protein [Cyanobacteriota bacterium]|nr:Tol biopolymer transporter periplasmic protein [Cyanobacteriota bacterium]
MSALLSGCAFSGIGGYGRRSPAGAGLQGQGSRQAPALSGNGTWLASLMERNGRLSLILQQQPDGRMVPLRRIQGHEPHSSPSLSWNGRYLAALVQQGNQRLAVIEDRLSGRLHPLRLPGNPMAVKLTLAPDAQRLAIELIRDGRRQVQMFDLSNMLEPDKPAGSRISGAPR